MQRNKKIPDMNVFDSVLQVYEKRECINDSVNFDNYFPFLIIFSIEDKSLRTVSKKEPNLAVLRFSKKNFLSYNSLIYKTGKKP